MASLPMRRVAALIEGQDCSAVHMKSLHELTTDDDATEATGRFVFRLSSPQTEHLVSGSWERR